MSERSIGHAKKGDYQTTDDIRKGRRDEDGEEDRGCRGRGGGGGGCFR